MKLLCAIFLSSLWLTAGDVSGKWSGSVEMTRNGENRTSTAVMVLKQDGTKITGTIGPNADQQFTIKAGNIEEDRISLEIIPESGPSLVKFALKLDGDDHITGEMNAEGDQGTTKGKVDIKREK